MKKDELPFEEAAELRTGISGWVCKTCNRFWGEDERMARWCCAKDLPCECGKRHEKSWTCCQSCQATKDLRAWLAKPEVEWDGEFPITFWDNDKWFFSVDDVGEWLADLDIEGEELENFDPFDFRWTTAEVANQLSNFELQDHVSDNLHEDDTTNFKEINETVQAWLKDNVSPLYWATGKRISRASLELGLSLTNLWAEIKAEQLADRVEPDVVAESPKTA